MVYLSILYIVTTEVIYSYFTALIFKRNKDYKIDICCFSTEHAALRSRRKDWLARNQDNVFEWRDKADIIRLVLAMIWLKIAHLVLSNNHLLTLSKTRR
jgi:hypothetical protein